MSPYYIAQSAGQTMAPPNYVDPSQATYIPDTPYFSNPTSEQTFKWNDTHSNAVMGGISGITSGLSQYGQERFVPGTWDAVKAAGQGAVAGSAAGPVGALAGGIIGGLTSSIMQPFNINKTIKNRNTTFNNTALDPNGRPVYVGGDVNRQGYQDIQNLNKTMDWDKSNILGLRAKARRKRNQIQQNLDQSIQAFNTAESSYRNRQNQMSDYYERVNSNNRLYNYYQSQQ